MRKHAGLYFVFPGAFFSLVTGILVLLIILSSVSHSSVLRNLYFLKVDISNLGTDVVPALDSLSDSEKAQLHKIKFFTVGLWGYCSWSSDSTIEYCSKPEAKYHFNLQDMILKIVGIFLQVNQPGDLAEKTDAIITLSKVMNAFYALGMVAGFIALIYGLISIPRFRTSKVITTILAFVSFVGCLIGSAIIGFMFNNIRDEINDGRDSIKASLGKPLSGMAFATVATSFIAFLLYSISICKTPRKSNYEEEKRPFLADVPLTNTTNYEPPPQNPFNDPAYAYSQQSFHQQGQHIPPPSGQHY